MIVFVPYRFSGSLFSMRAFRQARDAFECAPMNSEPTELPGVYTAWQKARDGDLNVCPDCGSADFSFRRWDSACGGF